MACETCGGKEFLVYDVPPGHALFGKLVPCHCTAAGRLALMFGGDLAEMSLDTFKPLTKDERTALRAAKTTAQEWATPGGLRTGLVFYAGFQNTKQTFPGYAKPLSVTGCGCGKTHLAVGLAKAALAAGHDVKFTTETELLRAIKASYGDSDAPTEAEIIAELGAPWLLVLDDIGTVEVKSTGWYQDIVYAAVNQRYMGGLPLVLTSNLIPDQLAQRVGPRTWSRVLGMTELCRLDGPDRRTLKQGG